MHVCTVETANRLTSALNTEYSSSDEEDADSPDSGDITDREISSSSSSDDDYDIDEFRANADIYGMRGSPAGSLIGVPEIIRYTPHGSVQGSVTDVYELSPLSHPCDDEEGPSPDLSDEPGPTLAEELRALEVRLAFTYTICFVFSHKTILYSAACAKHP